MNTGDLLKTRYKVINKWPGMKDFKMKVGDIVGVAPNFKIASQQTAEQFYREFPNLFKSLDWWEERTLEDMPQYVKYNKSRLNRPQWISLDESNPSPTNSDLELFKVEKWVEHLLYGYVRQVSAIWEGDFEIDASWLIPATQAEYLAHIALTTNENQ